MTRFAKAAAAIAAMNFDSPTKPKKMNGDSFIDKEPLRPFLFDDETSVLEDDIKQEDDLDELRKKFVGEIDLPESKCPHRHASFSVLTPLAL